eukprot:6175766-Pleurochrysis_carterae.AAC.1
MVEEKVRASFRYHFAASAGDDVTPLPLHAMYVKLCRSNFPQACQLGAALGIQKLLQAEHEAAEVVAKAKAGAFGHASPLPTRCESPVTWRGCSVGWPAFTRAAAILRDFFS